MVPDSQADASKKYASFQMEVVHLYWQWIESADGIRMNIGKLTTTPPTELRIKRPINNPHSSQCVNLDAWWRELSERDPFWEIPYRLYAFDRDERNGEIEMDPTGKYPVREIIRHKWIYREMVDFDTLRGTR
jgi:hypothetical protein